MLFNGKFKLYSYECNTPTLIKIKPILIRLGVGYEIRFDLPNFASCRIDLNSKLQFGSGINVNFYRNSNSDTIDKEIVIDPKINLNFLLKNSKH